MEKYKYIQNCLGVGFVLEAHRSGGGLRFVTLEKGDIKYYGEGPDLYEALRILNDDVYAGGREYKKVYGPIEKHYLTGSHPDVDTIDAWVYLGKPLKIYYISEPGMECGYAIDMSSEDIFAVPKSIHTKVIKDSSTIKWQWMDDPIKERTFKSSVKFLPRGATSCSTECTHGGMGFTTIIKRIKLGNNNIEELLELGTKMTKIGQDIRYRVID